MSFLILPLLVVQFKISPWFMIITQQSVFQSNKVKRVHLVSHRSGYNTTLLIISNIYNSYLDPAFVCNLAESRGHIWSLVRSRSVSPINMTRQLSIWSLASLMKL